MTIKESIAKGCGKWIDNYNKDGDFKIPVNSQGKYYKGVNIIALLLAQLKNGFKSNQWATFKQIKDMGGSVLKGEVSERIFFFTKYEKMITAIEAKNKRMFVNGKTIIKQIKIGDKIKVTYICPKMYRVFNLTQTTLKDAKEEIKLDSNIKTIIDFHNPEILTYDQGYACYYPELDIIKMPMSKYFVSNEDYFATCLHELAHWTGNKNRLKREISYKCKKDYAKEELVAELVSTVLLKHFNIKGEVKNHEKYIESWLTDLNDNDYEEAVKKSVKAISFILDVDESQSYKKVA